MEKFLFRKLFVLLICIISVSHQAYAADGQEGGLSLILLAFVVVLLLLLMVCSFYFRKQQRRMSGGLSVLKKENMELAAMNNSLKEKENELEKLYEELNTEFSKQEKTISTLSGSKKELEQFLIQKIKENDLIQHEVSGKIAEAERQTRETLSMHDSIFADTIHEMRTPLSLVLGSLSFVVQNKEEENNISSRMLSAYRNTLAIQDLADQLIGIRRTNDISSYLRIARYDIVEIVRQSCDLFVDWIAMNNVDFRVNTQTNKLWVWFDRRKMEFALRMLLSNSFKNTFVYGKASLDISVVREKGKAFCLLTVNDEGLDEEESTRHGLKQIIDMLSDIGGELRSTSDLASGTSYTLLIPLGKQHLLERRVEFVEPESDLLKLTDGQKEEISEVIKIIPQKRQTDKKLLIIDDSDQIRWFLKHVFNKEHTILEARNGDLGVQMAYEEMPDLILCDVMMPVKNGFEACRELKSDSRTSQIPIIMLTAKVESEDVIIGIEAGADDYITKPFDVEILHSKVNSLMRKREQMQHYFTNVTPDTETSVLTNPFMDLIIKNIEKHLDDSTFEAKVLANSLNMSLPTLYRKIKQFSDQSILELTRNIRLKKAAQLILTQQYSIQEVSEMVGFNDTATFRKRFTEQYGVTPSQYGQP